MESNKEDVETMNTDEKRALNILHDKDPEDNTLAGRFMDFLRCRKRTKEFMISRREVKQSLPDFPTPQELADEFIVWQERNPI